ncbi:MAG: phage tail protein [Lachnospiraceae bacterium]|nr:phage tail protein [Lachnospiraceae bacterium]
MNNRITLKGRSKMAKARAGVAQLPPIVGIAVGDGGTDSEGNVMTPTDELRHELLRRNVDSIEKITETSYRFSLSLSRDELSDKAISEMALYDSEGDIVAIKNFKRKYKDPDMEMVFEFDDTF